MACSMCGGGLALMGIWKRVKRCTPCQESRKSPLAAPTPPMGVATEAMDEGARGDYAAPFMFSNEWRYT